MSQHSRGCGDPLQTPITPEERHRYFVEMLEGYEIDSFALEVKLSLLDARRLPQFERVVAEARK